jgi:hypothetical protein
MEVSGLNEDLRMRLYWALKNSIPCASQENLESALDAIDVEIAKVLQVVAEA